MDKSLKIDELRDSLNNMIYLTQNVSLIPGKDIMVVIEFKEKVLNHILDKMGEYIYIMEKDNHHNNNICEDIKEENFHFQVLRKILGEKNYKEYILSGKYIEKIEVRDQFDTFKSILKNFIHDSKKQINLCHNKVIYKSQIQKEIENKIQKEKIYIGIFVAKQNDQLTRYIMQFGADMTVVWPQNLKENIKNEIKGLKQLYCID